MKKEYQGVNKSSYEKENVVNEYKEIDNYGLFRYEKRIIKKYFLSSDMLLDVGCGVGRVTNALYKMGYNVVGIDYSKSMIRKAKEKNPEINFYTQDILNTSFENELFNGVIFSFNGLMLIDTYEKRLAAVNEIKRILKPKGYFFFTTPFLDNKLNKEYWKNKISYTNKSFYEMSVEERILLGDELINDQETDFYIHIPLIEEVAILLQKVGFKICCMNRRIVFYGEENCEELLDDNYIWVAQIIKS